MRSQSKYEFVNYIVYGKLYVVIYLQFNVCKVSRIIVKKCLCKFAFTFTAYMRVIFKFENIIVHEIKPIIGRDLKFGIALT